MILSIRTAWFLALQRPSIVFCQNPSLALVCLCCLLKKILGFVLVADRHSNFKLDTLHASNVKMKLFHLLSKWSTKCADLTIVTNNPLKKLVDTWGGRGFVLSDALPSLETGNFGELRGKFNVVFICTYADDEPYHHVLEAASLLHENIIIYVTGNPPKNILKQCFSSNVVITGFLPQKKYDQLLASSDLIIDFTTLEWCLVCGAYEAIVLEKPLITSNTNALQGLLKDCAVYSNHDPGDIASKIQQVLNNKDFYSNKMNKFKKKYAMLWRNDFKKLLMIIKSLEKNAKSL